MANKVFEEDVELDAKMVAAGMKGAMPAIMNVCLLMRDRINADDVVARCEWLKAQPEEYLNQVIALVATNTTA